MPVKAQRMALPVGYCQSEIAAITEKWREIERGSEQKGHALASSYRLHIHPVLWDGIREYLSTGLEVRRPPIYPELKFLQLPVVVSDKVEGWQILEMPGVPAIVP